MAMSIPTDWIKMSDRKPGVNDFGVHGMIEIYSDAKGSGFRSSHQPLESYLTHWKPFKFSDPPAKELTQEQKDEEAFEAWQLTPTPEYKSCLRDAWESAITYARANPIAPVPPGETAEEVKRSIRGILRTGSGFLRPKTGADMKSLVGDWTQPEEADGR